MIAIPCQSPPPPNLSTGQVLAFSHKGLTRAGVSASAAPAYRPLTPTTAPITIAQQFISGVSTTPFGMSSELKHTAPTDAGYCGASGWSPKTPIRPRPGQLRAAQGRSKIITALTFPKLAQLRTGQVRAARAGILKTFPLPRDTDSPKLIQCNSIMDIWHNPIPYTAVTPNIQEG